MDNRETVFEGVNRIQVAQNRVKILSCEQESETSGSTDDEENSTELREYLIPKKHFAG
jgi:hypothetical protein